MSWHFKHGTWLCGLAGMLVAVTPGLAAEKFSAQDRTFFETKIRPVLVKHCYECHSAKSTRARAGLYLDTREGMRKGGDTGPAVVPGDLAKSLLINSLNHIDFEMPPKGKLPNHVIADFERWVKMGAPDPREGKNTKGYTTLTLEDSKDFWSFKAVVKPKVPAVKDASRWARGDVDRFILAGLEGKKLSPVSDAEPAILLRRLTFDLTGLPPKVEEIESFLQEYRKNPQVAVESAVDRLLASPHFGERWGRYWLDIARYAESNGNADNTPFPYAWRYRDYVIRSFNSDKPYNRFIQEQIAGDLMPAKNAKEADEQLIATGFLALTSKPRAQNNPDYKYDLIADQIDVTTRAVLGLSVMCARCHDHKFDPISTKEYYSMAGIFDSSVMLFGSSSGTGNRKKKGPGLHKLSTGEFAMGVAEGRAQDCNVCIRGESKKLGERVPRGFLDAVPVTDVPKIEPKSSGRLELAKWLTDEQNPFTARIAVNRMWQHLFGQGLVRSPDNFGNLGEKPTHPELLDYLAARFMEDGWSMKKAIRRIVLSRTYQLGSGFDEKNYAADPDNMLVWRMPLRRLDAEAIRDAILAVSGELDLTPLKGTNIGGATGKKKNLGGTKQSNHRSVYQAIVRGAPILEILSLFDIASPNLVVAQREVTTVPAQALFLMNSSFIRSQGRTFAKRLLGTKDLTDEERVNRAYQLAVGRPATSSEKGMALEYLNGFAAQGNRGSDEEAWTAFCQTLLACAEFRYLQ